MYKKVILIVDDEPDMLTLLDVTLKDNGYAVIKAPNANVALHLIKSFLPNLIVLDVLMPGMDGFELCERIRAIPYASEIPIIFLTALDTIRSRQRAVTAGANAFVAKEDFSGCLISEIRTLLNNNNGNSTHNHENWN